MMLENMTASCQLQVFFSSNQNTSNKQPATTSHTTATYWLHDVFFNISLREPGLAVAPSPVVRRLKTDFHRRELVRYPASWIRCMSQP
ncbi:hypothetical protein Ppro_0585 [Pelobacter propionicus DSM 2379]|uniref:Uncharacterized protein n=1 Tax=Pelobacter propionicus (strain DSM 2379 / NBRC 103807 / OttBd1) TaxID=338966 RepID=A1ALJ6_PELPD|nr:hypothetical protein Ppro_0585 [Pelobacter propionicus DSM 2379]